MRKSEVTLRHLFVSPYRCRDCRTRFWVLSRNSYYFAALSAGLIFLIILAWNAHMLLDMPSDQNETQVQGTARIDELLKLAEKEDAGAEYELARMYASGQGVQESWQEEQKWLERAASHGNVPAQYEYGVALRDGRGTVQDYQAARKWMQLAAEGSNASAQFALGQIYRAGLGTPIDNVKAYIWLNVAAAQGVPGAVAARDAVLPRLSAAELQEAQVESRRLSEQHIRKTAQSKP